MLCFFDEKVGRYVIEENVDKNIMLGGGRRFIVWVIGVGVLLGF